MKSTHSQICSLIQCRRSPDWIPGILTLHLESQSANLNCSHRLFLRSDREKLPWIQTIIVVPTIDAVVPVRSITGRFGSDVVRSVREGELLGLFGCFFALESLHLIRDRWQEGRGEGPRYPRSSARRGTLQAEKFRVQTSSLRNAHTDMALILIQPHDQPCGGGRVLLAFDRAV